MQLKRLLPAAALLAAFSAPRALAQPVAGGFDADFLFSYYDQDGEHSPVTGGIGTEKLEVASPVLLMAWQIDENLSLTADLGVDQISSASIGNIQAELSSASIPASDTRSFGTLKVKRKLGRHVVGLTLGAATEYDYRSLSYGLDWALELASGNTTLSASVRRFDDAIELIGIDGHGSQGPGAPETAGDGERTTTDLTVSLSRILGKRTVGSIDVSASRMEGTLSTPYHEVILPGGDHVAERLPDSRQRNAIGVRINHGFRDDVVLRAGFRHYADDWGITAETIELETHVRLPFERETWIYPILRWHTQSAADDFGPAGSFDGTEGYWTSDWDLADSTTKKYGLGWSVVSRPGERMFRIFDRFELRATKYDRDDGLSGYTASFSVGWSSR